MESDQALYEQAKTGAAIEHRSIAAQIELWAKVGRAVLDNPDLPVTFVAESLQSFDLEITSSTGPNLQFLWVILGS